MSGSRGRAIVLAALVAAGALACRKKAPPPPAAPPPRPADVVVEALVPDPSSAWTKARQLLGLIALPLPRSAFGLAAELLATPAELETSLEPGRPLVAIGCGDRCFAAAWALDDPNRLPTFAKDRFTLSTHDGAQWLGPPLGATTALRAPVGVVDRFLVVGEPATVGPHADYLLRGLARRTSSADVHVEVRRSRHPSVVAVLDRLAALAAAKPYPDAPSAFAPTTRALADLEKGLREWSTAERPIEVELSIASDTLTIVARPLNPPGNALTAAIPGEVLRTWIQARVKLALP